MKVVLRLLLAVPLLVLLSCQKTNADPPAPTPAPVPPPSSSKSKGQHVPSKIPGVDLSKLEPEEKKTFSKIVNSETCACGEPHSLSECAHTHTTCRRSLWAVKMVARRLRHAVPEEDIQKELQERYKAKKPAELDVSTAPRKGAADAPVTMVEFSDFECGYCKKTAPVLDKVVKDSGKVKLFYKHFPLSIHAHARVAAQAAVAAQKQGKFWAMHDKMFANQSSLAESDLLTYAADLGLDAAKFKEDLNSEAIKAIVSKDRAEGEKLDVKGTPTIYINGRQYLGPLDADELKAAIEEEVSR
jgi:protein-disulfide isomerase